LSNGAISQNVLGTKLRWRSRSFDRTNGAERRQITRYNNSEGSPRFPHCSTHFTAHKAEGHEKDMMRGGRTEMSGHFAFGPLSLPAASSV
jgi:hypothetical protein